MASPQQQFSLKWNNYSHHIVTALEELRVDDELTDVTLSCDGLRIKAHKVLLSACSVFFKETFKENPCKHPIVILKGVSFQDLQAVVQFMYNGQVNVTQERLSSFLQTAEILQIKGLTEGANDKEEAPSVPAKKRSQTFPSQTSSSIDSIRQDADARPPTPKRKRVIGSGAFTSAQNSELPGTSVISLSGNGTGITNSNSNPPPALIAHNSENSGDGMPIVKFEEQDGDEDYDRNEENSNSFQDDEKDGQGGETSSLGSHIRTTSAPGGVERRPRYTLQPSNPNDLSVTGVVDATNEGDRKEVQTNANQVPVLETPVVDELLEDEDNEEEVEMGVLGSASLVQVIEHQQVQLGQRGRSVKNIATSNPPGLLPIGSEFETAREDEDEEELRMFLEGDNSDDTGLVDLAEQEQVEEEGGIEDASMEVPASPEVITIHGDNDTEDYNHSPQSQLHPALLQQHTLPRRRKAACKTTLPRLSFFSAPSLTKPNILKKFRTLGTTSGPPILQKEEESTPTQAAYSIYQETVQTPEQDALDVSSSNKCLQPPIKKGPEDFACPYCERTYKLKASCESHIKIHEGNENECFICGQVMSRQRDLKRHMSRVHKANGRINGGPARDLIYDGARYSLTNGNGIASTNGHLISGGSKLRNRLNSRSLSGSIPLQQQEDRVIKYAPLQNHQVGNHHHQDSLSNSSQEGAGESQYRLGEDGSESPNASDEDDEYFTIQRQQQQQQIQQRRSSTSSSSGGHMIKGRPLPQLLKGNGILSQNNTQQQINTHRNGAVRRSSGVVEDLTTTSPTQGQQDMTTPNFSLTQQLLQQNVLCLISNNGTEVIKNGSGVVSNAHSRVSAITSSNSGTASGSIMSTSSADHTVVAPYVCDVCGKRYVHHRSLNDHKKSHTGATRCPVCNKSFSKVANMRAHFLAQHGNNITDNGTGENSNESHNSNSSNSQQQASNGRLSLNQTA